MLQTIKILYHQGKQFIPDLKNCKGTRDILPVDQRLALTRWMLRLLWNVVLQVQLLQILLLLILVNVLFAGNASRLFPGKVKFTTDYKMATNERSRLIIKEGINVPITLNPDLIRKEIQKLFRGSLKLRQVSAAGDNSCELELNACGNVNFDMGRYGIEFVASPRHADGIVITGPISKNMAESFTDDL